MTLQKALPILGEISVHPKHLKSAMIAAVWSPEWNLHKNLFILLPVWDWKNFDVSKGARRLVWDETFGERERVQRREDEKNRNKIRHKSDLNAWWKFYRSFRIKGQHSNCLRYSYGSRLLQVALKQFSFSGILSKFKLLLKSSRKAPFKPFFFSRKASQDHLTGISAGEALTKLATLTQH